jgi:lysozyme family protein
VAIYTRLYWLRPRFNQVARRAAKVAAELSDTGANMGPGVAATFLQRALPALNRNGRDYPDLVPDGRVGTMTLAALDTFLKVRGGAAGETVLLRALEALQGERYLRLAEKRPANEAFLYGWLANRLGENIG